MPSWSSMCVNMPRPTSTAPPFFADLWGHRVSRGVRFCAGRCLRPVYWSLAAAGLLLLTNTLGQAAEPVVHETFDGPDTSWKPDAGSRAAQILGHERVSDVSRKGQAERLVVAASAGDSVPLLYSSGRLPVLDELDIRLWVKSTGPGVRLAARVVLPRTVDAITRRPRTVLVRSEPYIRVGNWYQLNIAEVPRQLASEVRVLRATPGESIDPAEAYVDAVVLVVPGEPRGTTVWTDDLEIDGILLDEARGLHSGELADVGAASRADAAVKPAGWQEEAGPPYGGESPGDRANVRLQGMTLLVDGKPFVPRAIEWHGEPLDFLAKRGFNAILIHEPPTEELAAEAHQRDLWIIASPPQPDALARDGMGEESDRVLAWYLGRHVATRELDYLRRWAELVRQRDADASRPILVAPEIDLMPLSRATDVLLVHHPLGGNAPAAAYAEWFDGRPRLARPGTPFWALLDTQLGDLTRQQAALLAGDESLAAGLDDGRLEAQVRVASTHGSRGFLFRSSSPLNAQDGVTRRRAAALELVNRQLELIEPWLATGKVLGEAATTDGSATAKVLQVERARLLVPSSYLVMARQATAASPSATSASKAFVVPGVPESNRATLLTLAGLRPLASKRIAGGVSVALEPQDDGLVLLTEDPQVESGLRRRLDRTGRQAVELQKELVVAHAAAVTDTARRLEQLGYAKSDADEAAIKQARVLVGQGDALLAAGQTEPAFQALLSARHVLDEVAQRQQSEVTHAGNLISSPLAASYDTLAQQASLLKSLNSASREQNLLYGGDFEDLSQMVGFGWQHVVHEVPDVDTRAELVAVRPYHGKYCLQLSAEAKSARTTTPIVAEAPVWITSPPVPVTAGQVLEITGWVRVPEPIEGGAGSLEIADSLGGPELALSIAETDDWRPFRLLRSVPQTGQITLTFALDGLGTAWVDAVMVRAVDKATLRRLPTAPPAEPNTAARTPSTLYPSASR